MGPGIGPQERHASNQHALPYGIPRVSLRWMMLPKSIAQSFNAPAATDQPTSPSFFHVSMHQWRSVVRRMVGCTLAVALPSDTCSVQLSGGAFAVPKHEGRDRLICERRPQKQSRVCGESCPCPFLSAVAPLDFGAQALGVVHIIDTRNRFYLYQVDSSRWHTQVIGPRIPASWLHHLDDESNDDVTDDLETWWEPDWCRSAAATNLMMVIGKLPSSG